MKARHLIKDRNPPFYGITPHHSMAEAVDAMMNHRISSLVVMDNGHLVSIVTERDVMRTVYQHGGDFSKVKVQEAMAPELIVCQAEDGLDDVIELLFHNRLGKRIRHLPVLDNQELMGVISIRDIVNALLTETRFENRLLRNYIKNWPEPED
ncbi:MAG TPA: CBS domain-containing protein [Gammaproteobacteria bacterium]|nr:CBS domain-containing protein [Gammaproteobacteria bacterium]